MYHLSDDVDLENVPGFCFEAALKRAEGDRDLLLKRVVSFKKHYHNVDHYFELHLKSGELPDLQELVHNVKIAAGFIGAETLALLAADMERACLQADMVCLHALQPQFSQHLACVADSIDWLKQQATEHDNDERARQSMLLLLEKLMESLNNDFARAKDVLQKLSDYQSDDIGGRYFEELEDAFYSFDVASVSAIIMSWKMDLSQHLTSA